MGELPSTNLNKGRGPGPGLRYGRMAAIGQSSFQVLPK